MNFYIIIPAHNEEAFISQTIESLLNQTLLPKQLVVVDDHSTDATAKVVSSYAEKFPFIRLVKTTSEDKHLPGSKVVNAFYKGFETLDDDYDIICKFDADLIFPENYLKKIAEIFNENPKCGMAGGLLFIEKNKKWIYENISSKDHLRGPIKAYNKACFKSIDGLKKSIGWDTVDVLLAKFFQWDVIINENLKVKHLKVTGQKYNKSARYKQGETLYKLRYGIVLTLIASLKACILRNRPGLFFDYLKGYYSAKEKNKTFLVSQEQGKFIRNLRWTNIKRKLF
ncbi:MAG: glycosyltransferase [Flavobacteriaceae bacterium]|nr:glycosyltransferase [Flavobacteriaceae bacterium]